MCTSKSESDESAILECVDIKIILGNLPSKLLISIGYCQTNRTWDRIQLKFELFPLIYPNESRFSYNLISVGHCSTNSISMEVEYRFEFSISENLEVSSLWSEDRALFVDELDRGQKYNLVLFNFLCDG